MMTRQHWFHKSCFKCNSCNGALGSTSVCEDASSGSIFCKSCYISQFFTGGRSSYLTYQKSSGDFTKNDYPNSCLKCHSKVYEAEKIQVSAGLYHQFCLQCKSCSKNLEPTNYLEAKDKFIYCAGCYSANFGVRSRAKSCGPVDFKSIKPKDESNACKSCLGQVFEFEERLSTSFGLFHKACFRCSSCSILLESSVDSAKKCHGKICCRQCFDRWSQSERSVKSFQKGSF